MGAVLSWIAEAFVDVVWIGLVDRFFRRHPVLAVLSFTAFLMLIVYLVWFLPAG